MKTKLTKKFCSGLAIGCLFLTLGGLAAAHDINRDPLPAPCAAAQFSRPDPADMEQHVCAVLGKLVEQQTISREQADKILSFFKEKELQRQADFEKMKSMSPEDRKNNFEQRPHDHPNLIKDLTTAAGLSEDQAKTVADALRPPHFHLNMEQINSDLSGLVEKGAISQEQADKVMNFFKEKEVQHKADFEKMKAMSPQERNDSFSQHRDNHPDLIKDLMASTGLSAEQAKAVAGVVRPPHGPNPEGPCPSPGIPQ